MTGPITFKREGCEGLGTPPQSADFNKPEVAVGTGPYKLVSYTRGDRIILERNEAIGATSRTGTRSSCGRSPATAPRVAALLAGDVDLIESAARAGSRPYQEGRLHRSSKACRTASSICIWTRRAIRLASPGTTGKNPFLDAKVRAAFSKAINRKAIVERIMGGVAQAAGELLPAPMFGTLGREPEAYDPEAAPRSCWPKPAIPTDSKSLLGTPNDRYINDEKIAQAVAQMLARIGIKVKVDATTASQFFSAPQQAGIIVLPRRLGRTTGEMSSPLVALVATFDKATGRGATNAGRYSNPKMDAR